MSEVAQSCLTLCDPVDCSLPSSSIHGILQQEYWSGLPFPPPGDHPDPGIEPGSPVLEADALAAEPPGKPLPFPYPGYIPDPGIEPTSSTLAGGFFTTEPPGKPNGILLSHRKE